MYLRKCKVTISLEHPYCPFSFFLSQKPASFKNIPFAFIFLEIYNALNMPCPCVACHVQGILVCLNVRQQKLTEKSDIKM